MKARIFLGVALSLVSTLAFSASTFLTQTVSQIPDNSVRCGAGGTVSSWRAYDLAALNLAGPITITSVQFGIFEAVAPQPVTVNVYTSEGAFPGGVLTLRATQLVDVPSQSLTVFDALLTTPTDAIPDNSILVLEMSNPAGDQFVIGNNTAGETAPSYLSAPGCGVPSPVTLSSLGLGGFQVILNAIGTVHPRSFAENIAKATDAINSLMQPDIIGPAQKSLLVNLLGQASRYKDTIYSGLSLTLLNAALTRVDGCALRGTPDTVLTHGGAGMDFVTTCPAQAPIYSALKAAQAQFVGP